jgi:hypothetical protein
MLNLSIRHVVSLMTSHFNTKEEEPPLPTEEEWGSKLVWTPWKRDKDLSPI